MLFFFELGLFILVMVTLALGEFVGRGVALTLWLVVTVASLAGYLLGRSALARLAAGAAEGVPPEPSAALDARWARTCRHYWARTNLILVIGALVLGGWYWLATGPR